MSKKFSRRQFLGTSGGGILFCGGLGGLASLLSGCETHGEIPRVAGQSRSFITPTDGGLGNDFYIQFGGGLATPDNHPVIDQDDWELIVRGDLENDVRITWDDLMAVDESDGITFLKTMRCVFDAPGEPLISNAYWRGVPLKLFLEQGELRAEAVRLNITGEDGFTDNLRVARVMDDVSQGVSSDVPLLPVVLAYELNGAPIPSVHGGPVRIIVPEKFGFKCMKYPVLMAVTTNDEAFGYYETELFPGSDVTDTGNIAITSIFTAPVDGETVRGPRVTFFGVAMYGPGQIEQVEVSIDGGAFGEAEVLTLDDVLNDVNLFFADVGEDNISDLEAELADLRDTLVQNVDPAFTASVPYVWSIWRYSVDLAPGEYSAKVRSVATNDVEQPDQDREAGDGNSQVRRIVFQVV